MPSENEKAIETTERLEGLRLRIRELEERLASFGFDPRRGIESYGVGELKRLVARSPRPEEAKNLLMELIEAQEQLYKELYEAGGMKEMDVDTDTPEKRLLLIKKWLLGEEEERVVRPPRFCFVVKKVLDEAEKGSIEGVLDALKGGYKRDYDRHRVLRFLLDCCRELGIKFELPEGPPRLRPSAELLVVCMRMAEADRVRAVVRQKLRRRRGG